MRKMLGTDTFSAAIDRLVNDYEAGHRLVCSFSAGKDSGVCLELMIIAAEITGRLHVDVIIRDEEIMFPGTYEYAERMAARPEVNMHWIYARQPVINVFNRRSPYFWVFDPELDPDDWVRKPPDIAYEIPEKHIGAMVTPERFPPAEGKELHSVIGLRIVESLARRQGLHSSGGHLTKPQRPNNVRLSRPIYDWTDGDIWKAILDNGWDYNKAYDVMVRHGIKSAQLRIGPPTMNIHAVPNLAMARTAWPKWFDRVEERLPGIKTVAQFGKRAVSAKRRLGETWEETFNRECIETAPDWIAERSRQVKDAYLRSHARHSSAPFPDARPCHVCTAANGCYKKLTQVMYLGDPFSTSMSFLKYMEPEFFKAGTGTWGGKPTW